MINCNDIKYATDMYNNFIDVWMYIDDIKIGSIHLEENILYRDEFEYMDDNNPSKYSKVEWDNLTNNGNVIKILSLNIITKYRRMGFAGILLNHTLENIIPKKYNIVYLVAQSEDKTFNLYNLVDFYKKFGFNVIKDVDDAVDMIKFINI